MRKDKKGLGLYAYSTLVQDNVIYKNIPLPGVLNGKKRSESMATATFANDEVKSRSEIDSGGG